MDNGAASNSAGAVATVRDQDVLCGRGNVSNQLGNRVFLSIVSKRKDEYKATTRSHGKNQIAREVLIELSKMSEPPPRFLTPVAGVNSVRATLKKSAREQNTGKTDDSTSKANGCYSESAGLWRELNHDEMMEKAKMSLRQKPKGSTKAGKSTKAVKKETKQPDMTAEPDINISLRKVNTVDGESKGNDYDGLFDSSGDIETDAEELLGQATNLLDDIDPSFHLHNSLGRLDPALIPGTAVHYEPHNLDTSDISAGGGGNISSGPLLSLSGEDSQQGKIISTLEAARGILRKKITNLPSEIAPGEIESLGRVLYHTLTGISLPHGSPPVHTDYENDAKYRDGASAKRIQSSSSSRPSLLEFGFPVNLDIFISSLLDAPDATSQSRFTSTEQILEEIDYLLANSQQMLFTAPVSSDQLVFPEGKLYGRSSQQTKLLKAFQAVAVTHEEDRGIALISGISGSGKTSLVEVLIAPLIQRQGMLIPIKFDQQGREPMSAIFSAFDLYCRNIQGFPPNFVAEIRSDIKSALGPVSLLALSSQMPSLLDLTGDASPGLSLNLENKEIYNLILYSLRMFVRAIAAPDRPLAIMFDDLQWGDKESMDLILKLITDVDTKSCLFVGCYRDNEMVSTHPLYEHLEDIAMAAPRVWRISLDSLSREDVGDLLSHSFQLTSRICRPLADALVKKTDGNPLFVKNLILSLSEEGLLQYSASARRWDWDLDAILSKSVPDTAVGLLLDKMRRYDTDVQWMLTIASLFGTQFDAEAIAFIQRGLMADGISSQCKEIGVFLNQLLDDGLVMKVGKASSDSLYRFSHDQICQAAVSLTEVADIERMHLLIGRQLLKGVQLVGAELDRHIFTVVDQINRGIALITAHEEKIEIAELNLRAGEISVATSSFLPASIYLLQGCVLVSGDDWINHYDLCLRLYTNVAEVQLVLNNCDGAIISMNPVLKHGKTIEDKLRVHEALAIALLCKGKAKESQRHCIAVLDELGSPVPSLEVSESAVMEEFQCAVPLIENRSVQDILQTSGANRRSKEEAVMRMLIHLSKASYLVDDTRGTILSTSRMVNKSILLGVTAESSFAFAGFAVMLCGVGKVKLAALCGDVACRLLPRFQNKYASNVAAALNMTINNFRQPLQALTPKCLEAYTNGIAVGDVFFAFISLRQAILLNIFAPERNGGNLSHTEAFIRKHLMAIQERQILMTMSLPLYQCVLNLRLDPSGESNSDPTVLNGEGMMEATLLSEWKALGLPKMLRRLFFSKLWISYLFRQYDKAVDAGEEIIHYRKQKGLYPSLEFILETFYSALLGFASVRNGLYESGKWNEVATDCCAAMLTWAQEHSKWNFQNKSDLLLAEQAYTNGDLDKAAAYYVRSIEAAGTHGFVNEQALACERAGLFFLDQDNALEAKRYFKMAETHYGTWGAPMKVHDMRGMLELVKG